MLQEAEKKQVKISDVINKLENGINRKEIAKEYDLTPSQATILFTHPKIKGIRVKKAMVGFDIIDDIESEDNSVEDEVPKGTSQGTGTVTEETEGDAIKADDTEGADIQVVAEETLVEVESENTGW